MKQIQLNIIQLNQYLLLLQSLFNTLNQTYCIISVIYVLYQTYSKIFQPNEFIRFNLKNNKTVKIYTGLNITLLLINRFLYYLFNYLQISIHEYYVLIELKTNK